MKLAIARLGLWSQSGPHLLHNSLVYAIPEPQRGHHHCWEANDLARSFCVSIRLASLRRVESHELNKTALRLSEGTYKESAANATHTNHRKLTRTKKLRRSKSHCFKTLVEREWLLNQNGFRFRLGCTTFRRLSRIEVLHLYTMRCLLLVIKAL